MRVLAHISILRDGADPDLLSRIRTEFPEQIAPNGFRLTAPLETRRTQNLLDRLKNAGLTPHDRSKGESQATTHEYLLTYEREYDAGDLAACEYLRLLPPYKARHTEAGSRTTTGQLLLPKYKMPRGFDILTTFLHGFYFATERAKGVLELAELRRISFLSACFGPAHLSEGETEDTVAARYGQPFWELDSDFTLPPLSPSMQFVTFFGGRPWERGDFSKGLVPREGLFNNPELRYRSSDLRELEPFDLARTYEPFGNFRAYDRLRCPLIASKRFYETCIANKLKSGWQPVRVDPD